MLGMSKSPGSARFPSGCSSFHPSSRAVCQTKVSGWLAIRCGLILQKRKYRQASILSDYSLRPNEVLIVDDNHNSEIAAGVRLGIRTIQTLRPDVPRSPAATHHIQTLHELKPLLTPDD